MDLLGVLRDWGRRVWNAARQLSGWRDRVSDRVTALSNARGDATIISTLGQSALVRSGQRRARRRRV